MTVEGLKKYKDSCYAALSRDLTEFEKNFLLISGGILAFSTTFIKDVVKLPLITNLNILFAAWLLIISSMALMMQAFLKSATASDKLLSTVEAFEVRHSLHLEQRQLNQMQWLEIKTAVSEILTASKKTLKQLRNWAVITFIIGITLLALFVSINLHQQSKLVFNTIQQH